MSEAAQAKLCEPDFITVVTGVPRSGTSLMLQMLLAGGMAVATDGVRTPDIDNPRGYLELEAVKGIGSSGFRDVLGEMTGMAVKIVGPLVRRLPAGFTYRVIFVRRKLPEVIASQRKMLLHRGLTDVAEYSDAHLAMAIVREWDKIRTWADDNPCVQLLEVSYDTLVQHSRAAAEVVDAFLGGILDVPQMVRAVVEDLHRCRSPFDEDISGRIVTVKPCTSRAGRVESGI